MKSPRVGLLPLAIFLLDIEFRFAGQSLSQLQKDFADMRNTFHSRYVRIYGACDNNGFFDDVITAAWDNTLGVHALVWVSHQVRCA
jgi:hypothetical protein